MNPEYELYEQIDQYLSNNLSQEELTFFKSKMAMDKSLQEMVEAQKLANEIIIDNEMIRLKERMQEDLGKGGNPGEASHFKIIVSTVLIVSVSVASYVYFSPNKLNKGQVKNSLKKVENIKAKERHINIVNKKSDNSTQLSEPDELVKRSNQDYFLEPTENKEIVTVKEGDTTQTSFMTNNNGTVVIENNKINCDNIKIIANTNVEYGFNKTEATISIDKKSIQGGVAPYLFSLDKESFISSSKFENVKEGVYSVYIQDHNNCICVLQPVVVKAIAETKEIDDVFNPSNGDKWMFPVTADDEGTISIYNKAGSIVYSTRINRGYPGEWDGRDANGNELGTGNYYFIINFTNNQMVKGHITIVR